jgi:hypothetical protein
MKSKKIAPRATIAPTQLRPTTSDQSLSGPFALSMKEKASRAATKALVDRMRAERNAELTQAREKREEKRLESVRGQQKKGSTAKPPEKNSSKNEIKNID